MNFHSKQRGVNSTPGVEQLRHRPMGRPRARRNVWPSVAMRVQIKSARNRGQVCGHHRRRGDVLATRFLQTTTHHQARGPVR
jgi:hypothetical protein